MDSLLSSFFCDFIFILLIFFIFSTFLLDHFLRFVLGILFLILAYILALIEGRHVLPPQVYLFYLVSYLLFTSEPRLLLKIYFKSFQIVFIIVYFLIDLAFYQIKSLFIVSLLYALCDNIERIRVLFVALLLLVHYRYFNSRFDDKSQ